FRRGSPPDAKPRKICFLGGVFGQKTVRSADRRAGRLALSAFDLGRHRFIDHAARDARTKIADSRGWTRAARSVDLRAIATTAPDLFRGGIEDDRFAARAREQEIA